MSNHFRALILVMCWLQVQPCGMAQSAPKPAAAQPAKTGPSTAFFDFTPGVTDQDFDGFLSKVVVFKDGSLRRHVTLPSGWIAAGSSGEIYLTNPKILDARITLRVSSLEAPAKFDDGWIDTTKPLILGGLPKDASEKKIVNVTPNALNIQGWTSMEFKASYVRFGRRFSTVAARTIGNLSSGAL